MNSALNTTGGKMEEISDQLDDQRRRALNVAARQRDIIDDGEDLFTDYRTTTINALRGTQSFFDSDLDPKAKDVEAVLDAIDNDIGSGSGYSRRGALALLGITSASAAGGGVFAASKLFGGSDMEYSVSLDGEFEEFYDDLRTDQQNRISLVYGDEEELFGEEGRNLVAFEARDDGNSSTEPEYKLWAEFPREDGVEIDDYDWQKWNREDYSRFTDTFGICSEEERSGEEGYIDTLLKGDI